MVSNMFLVQSLDLMAKISGILGKEAEKTSYLEEAKLARAEFQSEYVTSNGRVISDTQAAYALAICLNLLEPTQMARAGDRLAYLVRKCQFKIGTGFAGTPFLCEALARTGHIQTAYAMILETGCPSWLYPVTMGATTVWERWDSMLPDGSVNPGEMTSFNHYAFGAVAKFLYERIAGLQRLSPGWKTFRVKPSIGARIYHACASHETPAGIASCSWESFPRTNGLEILELKVVVPQGTTAEVILPDGLGQKIESVGPGVWTFQATFKRDYDWPISLLPAKSN
jgi:alpha-L-rhamnosidase